MNNARRATQTEFTRLDSGKMRFLCAFLFLPALVTAQPIIAPGGIVQSGSYNSGSLVAGSLTTIFGANLATSTASASIPLPLTLNKVTVTLNGAPVPIYFVSPFQINIQVPWNLVGAQALLVIANENGSSPAVSVNLAPAAPALFTLDGNQAVATIAATRTTRAAHPGEYVRFYATGLGPVSNTPANGAPPDPTLIAPLLSTATTPPTAAIGGIPATVAFAGLAPQGINAAYAGLYEVDIQIPLTATTGSAVPVILSSNGTASNTATVAIDSTPAPLLARWTQFGPNGAMARAITSQPTCPALLIDGQTQSMQVRSQPSLPLYPVTSCEAAIPASATSAMLNQTPLPLPSKADYTAITVIGDTGCRLDTSGNPAVYQACNDYDAWPVGKISVSAAATAPQLIVMTGDYHYREAPCGAPGCVGSPWGYNWDTWNADLFSQVQPAFNAAPMFFIRGNHETCDRAGDGWFRYLDPRPYTGCQAYTDPYAVQAGSLQLLHVDSAIADDNNMIADQITAYQAQFDKLRQMATANAWMLTHRPLWAIRSNLPTNAVMQTASNNNLPDGIQMILSGHTHIFQSYTFDPKHAPQIVIGNGGDVLNAVVPESTLLGKSTGGANIIQTTSQTHFGFSTLTLAGSVWTIIDRAVDGTPFTTCQVVSKSVTCDK